jgi:hypothetical protein
MSGEMDEDGRQSNHEIGGSTFWRNMELAGLEPATSWVRSRVAFHGMGRFLPANSQYLDSTLTFVTG